MRTTIILAALAIAVPVRPDPNPVDNRPLSEQLQGEWLMTRSVIGGKEAKITANAGTVYFFTGERMFTHSTNKPAPIPFGIVVDETKTPAWIDFIAGTGGSKTAYPGLVKIERDTLTLCFTRAVNDKRPTTFHTDGTTPSVALFQFKRLTR